MTFPAILAVCLLILGHPNNCCRNLPAAMSFSSSTSESQSGGTSQAPPEQSSSAPAQPAQDSADHPANQPKPAPKPHHRKKASTSNCTTAAPAPNSGETSASAHPCPPPKKVVRNGGSDEPPVQLTGGTTAEHKSSTEQLRIATEENLKKIEGRQLSASQQDMKNQINQFMQQSKTAASAGDLDRAHDLVLKAHLLSDELVKP
jgi:hypothetical protein